MLQVLCNLHHLRAEVHRAEMRIELAVVVIGAGAVERPRQLPLHGQLYSPYLPWLQVRHPNNTRGAQGGARLDAELGRVGCRVAAVDIP